MPDETHNYLVNFETRYTEALQGIQQVTQGLQLFSQILRQTQPLSFQAAEGIRILTLETERLTEAMLRQSQVPGPGVRMEYFARGDAPPWGGVPYTTGAMDRPFPARTWDDFQQQQYGANIGGPPRQTTQYYEAYTPTTPVPPEPATTAAPRQTNYYYQMGDAMRYYTDETRTATTVQDEFAESTRKSGNWLMNYIERYLIRYFAVWQGMVAIKTTIRDWAQAHEDAERAMFRLQTTMGMTTDEAERYMATMRQMGGGIGISAAQLVGGAVQLGPTGAGMAGQFGAMAGIGAPQGMDFFAGIQRQYELTNAQIEQLIPRMFAAFARSGQDIQTFMGNWQEMLAQFDAGSMSVGEWTRALELYETTGMHASDRVKSAWTDLMSTMGNTEQITRAKNALADYFEAMIPTEAGRVRGLTAPEPITIPERLTIPPSDISAGIRGQFGIEGFAGKMTAAEAERYEDLIQKWDAYFLEQGRWLEKQTITLVTEIGQPLKMIEGSAEASKMALEEMNERQRSAVWNWPGGAPMIIMPEALGQVGATTVAQRPLSTTPSEPVTPAWSPHPIDWSNPWQMYQHGGVVQETGPAIVHKGETITPAGQSTMGYLRLQSDIYMDGNHVAQSVSTRLGDQLMQAQRASFGSGGGLISP